MQSARTRLGIALGASLAFHGTLLAWVPAHPPTGAEAASPPLHLALAVSAAAEPAQRQSPSRGAQEQKKEDLSTGQEAPSSPTSSPPTANVESTSAAHVPTTSADTSARAQELESLVHAAVEARKHYPLAAQRQGREGTARIGFQLLPNGQVDALTVLDTSGSSVLDRAALAAVQGIQPFSAAGDYLREARAMQIDIIFRLYTN